MLRLFHWHARGHYDWHAVDLAEAASLLATYQLSPERAVELLDVLAGVPRDARVVGEEVFGPVAPILTFETEDEAIADANDTEFGLVSYVYTRDLDRALRVCERLETGMVGLNQGLVSNPAAPFGGVKRSGLGREGGRVGIEEYLELKYVAINLT